MRDTHVLTPREAAEQTGLGLDTVLKFAADHAGVSTVVDEAVRILDEAFAEVNNSTSDSADQAARTQRA